MKSKTATVFAGVGLVAVAGIFSQAGPLDPPVGPIASTDRAQLNEQWIDLPYTIAAPGSYVLTSDLKGVKGAHGIIIAADHVTLDLNGFSLVGVAGSIDGVHVNDGVKNVTIANGVLRNWGDHGVGASGATFCRFRDLRAMGNGTDANALGYGLSAGGSSSIVDCAADSNTHGGIRAGVNSEISACIANGNATASQDGVGIFGDTNTRISDCTTYQNRNMGIQAGGGTMIRNCVADGNGDTGIEVGYYSIVSGSEAHGNSGGYGIHGLNGSVIQDCTASLNGSDGILAELHCTVSRCAARENAGLGIHAFDWSTITHCAAGENGDAGILVCNGVIIGCAAAYNGLDGMDDINSCNGSTAIIDSKKP